jgi:microcystin-dependent protein
MLKMELVLVELQYLYITTNKNMPETPKIEIVENTLLKLLIRRGTNADRLNVVFNQGEVAYTTDSKRLYVGDGATYGGIAVAGSKFLGETSDLTSLSPGVVNDFGYSTITKKLYYISSGDGSNINHWTAIAGLYASSDGTINISTNNNVTLGDAAGSGLVKDANNKLEIGSSIATDIINPKTTSYLTLPRTSAFGDLIYNFPTTGSANTFLRYSAGGNLAWAAVGGTSTTYVNAEILPVGTILSWSDSTLPAGGKYLRCDGTYVSAVTYPNLSAVLGTTYGALSNNGGTDHFKLPDLRGKFAIGYTNTTVYDLSGTGATFSLGLSGGEYYHLLSVNEMPSHRHDLTHPITAEQFYVRNNQATSPTGADVTRDEGPSVANDAHYYPYTNYAGGSSAHINIPPYLAVNYIIKALPDPVASCNITLADSLTASEATNGVVTEINPLSGDYTIGLASNVTANDLGYIDVSSKGLVTSYDTTSAGDLATIGANSTDVTHSFGFINFLQAPVSIASLTQFGTVPSTWSYPIQVYPNIVAIDGAVAPAVNIPNVAKNVILDVSARVTDHMYMYASLEPGLSSSSTTAGTNEYLVARTGEQHSSPTAGTQVTIPLSANANNGTIGFVLRGINTTVMDLDVRIVGWTL